MAVNEFRRASVLKLTSIAYIRLPLYTEEIITTQTRWFLVLTSRGSFCAIDGSQLCWCFWKKFESFHSLVTVENGIENTNPNDEEFNLILEENIESLG
jgi:hypothetical protein